MRLQTFTEARSRPKEQVASRLTPPEAAAPSLHPSTHPLLHLQRTIGNQATLQLLRRAGSGDPEALSRKQVVRMPEPRLPRACACGGECSAGVVQQSAAPSRTHGGPAIVSGSGVVQRQPTPAGRRVDVIEVVFVDDGVEFYHRIIQAIHRSAGFRGVPVAGLWQPFHDRAFAIYNQIASSTRAGERVVLRASVWFDPTVFHGQVTGGTLEFEQKARLRETTVTAILTPRDNFAGRSADRLGLAEVADLSFSASPAATANDLGGLNWEIGAGGGTLTPAPGNTGRAVFTAAATPGGVRLELRTASGRPAGLEVAHLIVSMVAPDDAVMEQIPGTGVQHANGQCSVGFCGRIFLRPVDVSFRNIQFSEGEGIVIASGYYHGIRGASHCASNPCHNPIPVGDGNSSTGSKVLGVDNAAQTNGPPFAPGFLLWPITWQYRVGSSSWVPFTVAKALVIADGTGRATISKKGSTPVSAVAADPTNIVNCAAATP